MAFLCCRGEPIEPKTISPEPIKFKILKLLNIFDPVIRLFILPKKKQPYKFPRDHLTFLSYKECCHIPVLYLPAFHGAKITQLIIYCHGSGSNLNNLYNFGNKLKTLYGISVLLYDYTGDGESSKQFFNYQTDIKVVLAWAQHLGYDLSNVIICGYSIGSYSALLVPGPMGRILISPICGVIPFVEGTTLHYEGEVFDNFKNAQKIKSRVLMIHGANEMIPYSHSQALIKSLKKRNNSDSIQLYKVDGFNHLQMPNFLLEKVAMQIMKNFLTRIKIDASKKFVSKQKQVLQLQLKEIESTIIQTKVQQSPTNDTQ